MSNEKKAWMALKCAGSAFVVLSASSCAVIAPESVTLKTELPANFRLHVDARYVPATGETCTLGRRAKTITPFKSERQEVPHAVEFKISLTNKIDGCPLVLKSVKLDIEGKYGPNDYDSNGDNAYLSFIDGGSALATNAEEPPSKIYNGECEWLFRTMGPKRYLAKILRCRAVDENDQVLLRRPGGYLQRDQWVGKTVSISFRVTPEETPYFKNYWFQTVTGWKPCGGRWGRDIEELCLNPPQFKDFRMPDGRECTVYPNCTE